MSAAHQDVCRRFIESLDGWLADRRPPLGLVHGDYRLDNMLFASDQTRRGFVAVDWQTVSWGPVMIDAAYFLGGSLSIADRRAHEQTLVREYYDALCLHGVRGFDWEECWSGYRRATFLGILMTVVPVMLVERTERGDQMFMTTLERYAQQILDLGALELLPEPGSGRPPPLRPQPSDEQRHDPGPEELWNESWYFDAISDDSRVGMYTRLGLYPNLGVAWITAFVCGPGRATVAVIDFAAPLPTGDELTVDRPGLHVEHGIESGLERFRVRMRADGEAHADASATLRGEAGDPVPVTFDLVWETLGDPYAYRVTTRYEIPCRVSGTVTIADEAIDLRGVGQRDHSWGTRDWWSAEWMWSAGHLQDGTRLHGVEFRIPGSSADWCRLRTVRRARARRARRRGRLRAGRRRRPDHRGADRLRRPRRERPAARLWPAPARSRRRTHLAVPEGHVPHHSGRWTQRRRVGRVEPQRIARVMGTRRRADRGLANRWSRAN